MKLQVIKIARVRSFVPIFKHPETGASRKKDREKKVPPTSTADKAAGDEFNGRTSENVAGATQAKTIELREPEEWKDNKGVYSCKERRELEEIGALLDEASSHDPGLEGDKAMSKCLPQKPKVGDSNDGSEKVERPNSSRSPANVLHALAASPLKVARARTMPAKFLTTARRRGMPRTMDMCALETSPPLQQEPVPTVEREPTPSPTLDTATPSQSDTPHSDTTKSETKSPNSTENNDSDAVTRDQPVSSIGSVPSDLWTQQATFQDKSLSEPCEIVMLHDLVEYIFGSSETTDEGQATTTSVGVCSNQPHKSSSEAALGVSSTEPRPLAESFLSVVTRAHFANPPSLNEEVELRPARSTVTYAWLNGQLQQVLPNGELSDPQE